jgi:cytochrome P450
MAFADNLTGADLEADPYPIYARLRHEAPVAFVPALHAWLVTRWQEAAIVASDKRNFTAEVGTSPLEVSFGQPNILNSEGDSHRILRDGIEPHYRPKSVSGYIHSLVEPIADEYLDRIAARGSADLMAEYFEPISVLSLARSLGFHDVDVTTLRRWFRGLSLGVINFERDPARQAVCDAVCAEIDACAAALMSRLERRPDNSPLSCMLHNGMPDGETRSQSFLMPTIKVALLGGMQEPGHGAGTILTGLLTNPAQRLAVQANINELLPKAIDEGLRWVAPIGTQQRRTLRDVELAGTMIPRDAMVCLVIASASRDERRFSNPDDFNIYRAEGPHASFGFGAHFCAGRSFATAQINIALKRLFGRIPGFELEPGFTPRFQGWEFRAPIELRVRFRPV